MVPIVWAQAIVEYGIMATLSAKVAHAYNVVEWSIRTNSEAWLLGCGAVLLCFWLFKRA
jgi:hypothetical protein